MDNLIETYNRDERMDYVKILKALKQIPFDVGRTLLKDFLLGNYKNKSVVSNNLHELSLFGSWKDEEKMSKEIDQLLDSGCIEIATRDYNRFAKILRLTAKGEQQVYRPTLHEVATQAKAIETSITSKEQELFYHLKHFLEGFNDAQKKAIIDDHQQILCIAGAGSGKTMVLTKRIEFLVRYKGVPPEKILAITFTRKAKEEMEYRLNALRVTGVHVHTFNSFCESILRKHEQEIYSRKMRVQSYSDKIFALQTALLSLGLDIKDVLQRYYTDNQRKHKEEQQLFHGFVNDCFFVLEYFKTVGKEFDFSKGLFGKEKENAKLIQKIVALLQEHMNMAGLRDYTDQILDTIDYFRKQPLKVPSYEYVLIDEYQDINALQQSLIELLHIQNHFVVGDPRQAIFGWRGSNIAYINDYVNKNQDVSLIHLSKNYRSSKEIVKLMNLAIQTMHMPDLEHAIEKETLLELKACDSEEDEMNYILSNLSTSPHPLDTIFVLSRTNRQITELSKRCKSKGIPHAVKTDDIKNQTSPKAGEVLLATIHAIKGLEAREVFILGCTEQNFPCKASDHPALEMLKIDTYDKHEEERRLFYVALSRAKERLHLTYSGQKPTYFITKEMKELFNSP